MKGKSILVALCLCVAVSCGYRFAGTGDAIDPSIRTVYVASFINDTSEALVENYVRNAFIDEFRRSGRFSIAGSAEAADARVSGTVLHVRTSRATYTSADSAVEDRVHMRLDVTFEERGGDVLWSQRTLEGNEAYRVGDDTSFTERNRSEALRKLASDLAARGFRSMMTGF